MSKLHMYTPPADDKKHPGHLEFAWPKSSILSREYNVIQWFTEMISYRPPGQLSSAGCVYI